MPAISRGRGPVPVLITIIDRKSWLVSPGRFSTTVGQAEVTKTVRFMHIGAGFQGPKMDILVADDDPSGRFLLNSTLVELGHSVTEAANGSMPGKHGNAGNTSWLSPIG